LQRDEARARQTSRMRQAPNLRLALAASLSRCIGEGWRRGHAEQQLLDKEVLGFGNRGGRLFRLEAGGGCLEGAADQAERPRLAIVEL
jgi:hypothetical protein